MENIIAAGGDFNVFHRQTKRGNKNRNSENSLVKNHLSHCKPEHLTLLWDLVFPLNSREVAKGFSYPCRAIKAWIMSLHIER